MAQVFHPITNVVSRVTILGGLFLLLGLIYASVVLARSSYATRTFVPADQPVPFSHKHHVNDLGIDCRFCHSMAEQSPSAGMPATKVCMTCHSQIHADSRVLEPVRASLREKRPIVWTRVHDLPDFVHFNHSIHVARGVACRTCHGAVDQMALTWAVSSMQMEWCLECHREPERFIGPRAAVFEFSQAVLSNNSSLGAIAIDKFEPNRDKMINCSVCHS